MQEFYFVLTFFLVDSADGTSTMNSYYNNTNDRRLSDLLLIFFNTALICITLRRGTFENNLYTSIEKGKIYVQTFIRPSCRITLGMGMLLLYK